MLKATIFQTFVFTAECALNIIAVRDIAKELNVQYVLEGSVPKAGNDIRMTAQLIDAGNLIPLKYVLKINEL